MCDDVNIGDIVEINTAVSNENGFMSFRKETIIIKDLSDLSGYPSLVNFKKIKNGNNKVYKGQ